MEYPCYRIYNFDDGSNILQVRMCYSEEEREKFTEKNDDYKEIDRLMINNTRR